MKTKKAKKGLKTNKKKSSKRKIIVASIAVGAAGVLGYFSWQYFRRKSQTKTYSEQDVVLKTPVSNNVGFDFNIPTSTQPKKSIQKPTQNIQSPEVGSGFPLSKGSKGDNVKQLQLALIKKYGKSILPKYGADGDFGGEMISALKKLGLPGTISESTFNVLVQAIKIDKSSIGKELLNATLAKDYTKVLSTLKKMESTEDYAKASEVFKDTRINGVHQTIVNALLNTFTTDSQKQAVKFEFLRMGLQFDGSKWSLSGIDGLPLITIEPTTIWVNAKESVSVPARMVLGNEISKRLDYTLFENKGKYFLVTTKSVNYL